MTHYIPYNEKADIDYRLLLCLYCIAKSSKADKLLNTIKFSSLAELAERITAQSNYSISKSTLSRHLKSSNYLNYFNYNKQLKVITLNNNFKKTKSKSNKFITITESERDFLLQHNDNLLCKYFCYVKFYCGKSKDKSTDFTAKQFLLATGYSCNSGSLLTQISEYNRLLSAQGFISIKKYRDQSGNERNIYTTRV